MVNSLNHDQMPPIVATSLGLSCLLRCVLHKSVQILRVYMIIFRQYTINTHLKIEQVYLTT